MCKLKCCHWKLYSGGSRPGKTAVCSVQCTYSIQSAACSLQWGVSWLKCALCRVNPARQKTTVQCKLAQCPPVCSANLNSVQCAVKSRRDCRLLLLLQSSDSRLQTALPTSSLHSSLHFQTFPNLHIITDRFQK